MKKTLLSIVLCVALMVSSASIAVSAAPTVVDGTMNFSLLPGDASAFTCVAAGEKDNEGNVTVTKNANGSLTFKGDKGWPYAFNTDASSTEEPASWADVDFTQDVYLNFDFQVKAGQGKVVVYFCGQNPKDMAAIGNYIDLNALILKNYDPLTGGTPVDLGAGFYQGSINLKDLYVDVDFKKDPYINRDLVVFKDANGTVYTADQYADADPKPEVVRTYSYVSGFKVFAVGGGEVIVNDLSVGAAKYGEPAAVVKELNLLTNGSSNGENGESEVTFADGVYTVNVTKGFDAATNVAYGMQVMAQLKDFDLSATTNIQVAIESDTPWRLTTLDAEINAWFGYGANFATVKDVNGTDQTPDTNGFYPAGKYELCNDYGSIYTWNAKSDPKFDVSSACLDGIYIEAMNPGTMKISTLKLSGSPEFKATPGIFTEEGAGNDDTIDKDGITGEEIPGGTGGNTGNGGSNGGNTGNGGSTGGNTGNGGSTGGNTGNGGAQGGDTNNGGNTGNGGSNGGQQQGDQNASGGTNGTVNNGGSTGGGSAATGDVSNAALFIIVAVAAAAVVTLSAVSKKAKSR